jgi:hypothetical protein
MEAQVPEETPQRSPRRKIFRSFFTKKLERKFEEKELEVPQQLLSIMDIPFDDFTPEDMELYETKIKPLSYVFVEHLMEVYECMGRPRKGWEEMIDRCDPSPIKVLATLVIHENEKVQELEQEEEQMMEVAPVGLAATEKISIRPYNGNNKEDKKERWWEKKVF